MSFIKNQLKVARSAINDKNYEYSAELCSQILENDPLNYNARVFLGLSLMELGEVEKSKQSYLKAIDISSDNLLAFNGLFKLYQQVNDVENQLKVLEQMGTIYGKSKDSGKYSENLDKLLQLSENLEDKSAFKSCLRRYLPDSQYQDLIINCPSEWSVWLKLHEISKQEAEIWVKNQVQSRKTRLGAGPLSQVQENVEKEMIEMSDLGEIFTNLFKFELDFDSKFRIVDSAVNFWWMKLKYGKEKHYCLKTLSELIVKCRTEDIPCKTAWVLSVEFEDLQLESRSLDLIRNKQFLDEYNIFVEAAYSLTEVEVDLNSLQAEILVALEQTPKSILGNQVLVQSLLMQEDWANAKKSVSALLEIVSTFERETSLHYPVILEDCHIKLAKCNLNSGDAIEALSLYRTILKDNPKQVEALKGMGFAYLDIKQQKDAIGCFQKIIELHPNDSEARADLAWALFLDGQAETALPLLEAAHVENETYLSNYRMARIYWEMGDQYVLDKNYCHRHLVQSIKLNPHFSSSFTYLGHYYHFKENDDERASKCYSKAISINPTDSESIKTLIEIWLSSMRIGDAQKLLEEYSANNPRSPYSWKQLGILSLHGGQYQTAINQLQSSLRIDASDHVCWISLGEAYLNSGKYVASLKSLNRALEINAESASALFLRGKVNHILARYDQGLDDFLNVPKYRSNLVVNMALADLLLAYGIDLFGSGAFGAALDKFQEALEVGIELANSKNEKGFSLIGDILRKANDLFPFLLTEAFHDCVAAVSKILQQQFSAEFISFSQHISPVMATEKMGTLLLTASFAYSMAMQSSTKTGRSRTPAYLGNISYCILRIYLQSPNPLTLAASLRYCKSAIKFDSKNPELWDLLGVITAMTEPHISQHSFIMACEFDENNAKWWSHLGIFYYKHNDLDLAAKCFKRAQLADSEFALPWLMEGLISEYLGNSSYPQFFSQANEFKDWRRWQTLYHFARVNLATDTGSDEFRQGLLSIQKCNELQIPSASINNLYGLYLERNLNFAGALAQYRKAKIFASAEELIIIQENIARAACSSFMFKESVELYEQFVEQSTDCMVWTGYGISLFFQEQYDDCFLAFEKALKFAENVRGTISGEITILVGKVLVQLGGPNHLMLAKDQILNWFKKLIRIKSNPQYIPAYLHLGMLALILEDWEMAKKMTTYLLSLELQKNIDTWREINFVLSSTFLLQGNIKTALNFISRAVPHSPANPSVWLDLVSMLCRTGKQTVGLRMLGLSKNTGTDHQRACFLSGASLLSMDSKKSQRYFSRALFMEPRSSKNWLALGMSCENARLQQKVFLNAESINNSHLFFPWISIYYCLAKLNDVKAPDELYQYIEMLDTIATSASSKRQRQAAYIALSRYLVAVGQYDHAMMSIRQAFNFIAKNSLESQDMGILSELSALYLARGNVSAALKCLELEAETPTTASMLQLAIIYIRLGDYAKSADIAGKAIMRSPNSLVAKFVKTAAEKRRGRDLKYLDLLRSGSSLPDELLDWLER